MRYSSAGIQPRIVFLGVGNEFNGDDAIGLSVLRALKRSGFPPDRFLLIDAGLAPENFAAPILRFTPDWVLAIDAARMGFRPGQVGWIELDEIASTGAATHGLPLSMLGSYLVAQAGCRFDVLGIQVERTDFDQPVSPAVRRAGERVVKGISRNLC